MVSKPDPLTGPRIKVERAKEHFNRLHSEIRDFGATNPYEVSTKRDPETRKPIYYISRIDTVPPSLSLLAGETMQALRSALDYLAYQLVRVGTGKPGPIRYVYFPISGSPQNYEARKTKILKGASETAVEVIDAVKPYKGGNDLLWKLHELNIIDKHRLLIVTVGRIRSMDIVGMMSRELQAHFPGVNIPELAGFIRPAETGPLKVGDVLFVGAPDQEVDKKMKFRVEIAFYEPGVCEGEPIIGTLHQMIDFVDNLIPKFAPLFSKSS